jgi:hypothetical protein
MKGLFAWSGENTNQNCNTKVQVQGNVSTLKFLHFLMYIYNLKLF